MSRGKKPGNTLKANPRSANKHAPLENVLERKSRWHQMGADNFAKEITDMAYADVKKFCIADLKDFMNNQPSKIGRLFTVPKEQIKTIDYLRNNDESAYSYRALTSLAIFCDKDLAITIAKEGYQKQENHIRELSFALAMKDYNHPSVKEYSYVLGMDVKNRSDDAMKNALATLELFKNIAADNITKEVRIEALDNDAWIDLWSVYPNMERQLNAAEQGVCKKLEQQLNWLSSDGENDKAREYLQAVKNYLGYYPEDLDKTLLSRFK